MAIQQSTRVRRAADHDPTRALIRMTSVGLLIWWSYTIDVFDVGAGNEIVQTGSEQLALAADAIGAGSMRNVLVVLGLFGLGSLHLGVAIKRLQLLRFLPGLGFLAYLLWALASFLWSDTPDLTLRRLVELGLVAMGGVGLGVGFYGCRPDGRRRLPRDLIVAGVVAMVAVWVPALLQGDIAIWDPRWSVARVATANTFGIPIAVAMLAGLVARYSALRYRFLASPLAYNMFFAISGLTLLALRKRTLLMGAVIVLSAAAALLVGVRSRRKGVAKLTVGGMAALLGATLIGSDPVGSVGKILVRGNDEATITSLTGRVPLWTELFGSYIPEHLLGGYGFGAFWTPDRLDSLWSVLTWPAVSAHNGYIQEVLQTGLIGTALVLVFWWGSAGQFWVRALRERDSLALLGATTGALIAILNLASTVYQDYEEYNVMAMLVVVFAVATLTETPQSRSLSRRVT